jgi:REP element-mobilizing transposase RayT
MNRGDRREPIFTDDQDRTVFLTSLGACCDRTGWEVHALCLMPNHFHLVVETPQPNLAEGMKWLLGVFTRRFNLRHKLLGHLFSGRYKALVVDGSADGYLKSVCDYVHLNPARARLLRPHQPLREYRWSRDVGLDRGSSADGEPVECIESRVRAREIGSVRRKSAGAALGVAGCRRAPDVAIGPILAKVRTDTFLTPSQELPLWLTPGAAEVLATKVFRTGRPRGLFPVDSLAECLSHYQPPVPRETLEFQMRLALVASKMTP